MWWNESKNLSQSCGNKDCAYEWRIVLNNLSVIVGVIGEVDEELWNGNDWNCKRLSWEYIEVNWVKEEGIDLVKQLK